MILGPQNKLDAYDFELPEDLIARYPRTERDQSRLLHYNLESQTLKHLYFSDIGELLKEGDILLRNNSQVMASRFYVSPIESSEPPYIEILLIKAQGAKWQAIAKPLRKIKTEGYYRLKNSQTLYISRLEHSNHQEISAQILVDFGSETEFQRAINEAAEMPIPPYLKRRAEAIDRERYQTVYAKNHDLGFSIAAPTAGLHFTKELISNLESKGIEFLDLTLHVGLGTFLPIKSQKITEHKMHSEYYEISNEVWQKILAAKKSKRRIIAVGTTATRALESAARQGSLQGETDIFIYPPYEFQIIDGLISNFHLPRSTLLLLVSAFAGSDTIKQIYSEAIQKSYRFFSYGDAMLLSR